MNLDGTCIIMHDNGMEGRATISGQLRRRRGALGLSLADVARRAGTSAAALSRYENGWTRFETYTLRKLALALGCDLKITLAPRTRRHAEKKKGRNVDALARLRRLFWDHPLAEGDLAEYPVWVVERVIEYGDLDDVEALREAMGPSTFLQCVAGANRVSPRTRSFWTRILELEGIQCTTRYSRNTAWTS